MGNTGYCIIIFGASCGVGQLALENGDSVTAFVRTPTKLTIEHENLTIIQGDVTDYAAVEKAIAGHYVVISCLGSDAGMKLRHNSRI